MATTRIETQKFLQFLAALVHARCMDEAEELFIHAEHEGTTNPETGESFVVIADDSLYNTYAHARTQEELAVMLMTNYPRVLDGTEPITIYSTMRRFPKFDKTVSPILDRMLTTFNDSGEENQYWNLTFTFTNFGSMMGCSVTGAISTPAYSSTVKPSKQIRLNTVGFDVKMCLEMAEMMLAQDFNV